MSNSHSDALVFFGATGDLAYNTIVFLATAGLLVAAIRFVLSGVGIGEVTDLSPGRNTMRKLPDFFSASVGHVDVFFVRAHRSAVRVYELFEFQRGV